MQIKKFEAPNMSEALKAVREAMGADALILSTREISSGEGKRGSKSRTVFEVTAAIDPPDPKQIQKTDPSFDFDRILKATETFGSEDGREDILRELQEIRKELVVLNAAGGPQEQRTVGRIQDACIEMREMIQTLVKNSQLQKTAEAFSGTKPLIRLFEKLTAGGMDDQSALEFLTAAKQKLTPADLMREGFVFNFAKLMIEKSVRVAPSENPREEPKVVMLVGPTGVGKTTTIAKLAARHFGNNKKATLITLDTHRGGAIEQLQSYAKKIGTTVEHVDTVPELREMLSSREQNGLVLIDTPGWSSKNAAQMKGLGELRRLPIPVETHLVLSLGTKESDLYDMVEQFAPVRFDRLLFTKLDETRTFGALFSAARIKDTPLSYITTGQRVPGDIEEVTAKRVAELVLN